MKELSIEEKAKAYDEKLDVARHIYADPSVKDEDKYYIEVIFPELAESEDERIRKDIIATIHLYYGEPLEDEAKEMIAWLEKQANHANFCNKIQIGDKVTRNRDGVLVNLSQLKRVAKDEKQGEQKPEGKIQLGKKYKCIASPRYSTFMIGKIYKPEDKFLCSLMNFCSDCFEPIEGEQKPAFEMKTPEESLGIDLDTYNKIVDECIYELEEQKPAWSEDDEKMIEAIEALCDDKIRFTEFHDVKEHAYTVKNWLKSLKDRVQPKQEWSEEDEKIAKTIINEFEQCSEWCCANGLTKEDCIAWLNRQIHTKWSEEDKKKVNSLYVLLDQMVSFNMLSNKDASEFKDWLKSIRPQNRWISVDKEVYVKEPVLAQKKDKSDPFGGFVVCCDHMLTSNVYERYMILGNIVSQNTWKPSKEQITALRWVLNNVPYNKHKEEISGLLDQIKEL